mgnify:CR=1 FL=1
MAKWLLVAVKPLLVTVKEFSLRWWPLTRPFEKAPEHGAAAGWVIAWLLLSTLLVSHRMNDRINDRINGTLFNLDKTKDKNTKINNFFLNKAVDHKGYLIFCWSVRLEFCLRWCWLNLQEVSTAMFWLHQKSFCLPQFWRLCRCIGFTS